MEELHKVAVESRTWPYSSCVVVWSGICVSYSFKGVGRFLGEERQVEFEMPITVLVMQKHICDNLTYPIVKET